LKPEQHPPHARGWAARELRRFGLYVASGFAATGAHYLVMIALVTWADAPEVVASSIGFAAGACVKYPLNYWTVFASRERHRVALPRFIIGISVGFALNALVLAIFLRLIDAHYMVSQVLTTGVVLFANYLLARYWIFAAGGNGGEKTV